MAKVKKKTLREALDEATTELTHLQQDRIRLRGAFDSISAFADDQYKHGSCLNCPDDGHNDKGLIHSKETWCWVEKLDKLIWLY